MLPAKARRRGGMPRRDSPVLAILRALLCALSVVVLGCLAAAPVLAQQSVSLTIEKTGEALSLTEDALDASRRAKAKLDAQVTESKQEVLRVRRELVDAAAEAQDIEVRISTLEADLAGLEEEQREKHVALDHRRGELARTLGALQRIGRTPPDLLIFTPASLQDISHARLLLSSVADELDARAEALGAELLEMMRLVERISARRDLIDLEAGRLEKQRERLGVLLTRKTQAYDRAEAQHRQAEVLVANLAAEAETLQELLERLVAERRRTERKRRAAEANAKAMAAAEAKAAAEAEAAAIAHAMAEQERSAVAELDKLPPPSENQQIASISVMIDPESPGDHHVKSQIGQKSGATASPVPEQAENPKGDLSVLPLTSVRPPVSTARGSFAMPARGKLISKFDETTDLGFSTKGIVIETRSAAQIITPYDGRIAFAGRFREYGLLLIIDHGEGYHTLLAGMGRIDVLVDQRVLAGEPVGVMQSVPDGPPRLYVELRSDGHPINPLPWLAAETIKISG